MKLLLIIILLFSVSLYSFSTKKEHFNNEYVVLLHGLARSNNSMNKMEKALIQKGYKTCNIKYPSTKYSIQDLSKKIILPKILDFIPNKDVKLSFVTHSMGGIIVRQLLENHEFTNLASVVMLSPPNKGSEIIDVFGENWIFKKIHGPAGLELGTDSNSTPNILGDAKFKLGVITGSSSVNLILSLFIKGDNDGKVSIESAKLEGMADFLVVKVSHPFIMKNKNVIKQTLYFLENGEFLLQK